MGCMGRKRLSREGVWRRGTEVGRESHNRAQGPVCACVCVSVSVCVCVCVRLHNNCLSIQS